MQPYLEQLKDQFCGRVGLNEKRPGIYQLMAPFYHEDGDMLELYIEDEKGDGEIKISDHGMTLMRLSYDFDLDSENWRRVFNKILSENMISENNGRLFINTKPDMLFNSVYQFAQAVGKVSNLRILKREMIRGLFYETLNDFVFGSMVKYEPESKYLPILQRDDLEVDYYFKKAGNKPLYLFGVKDDSKARITTISCLEFAKARLPFTSIAVHEDSEQLSKKDRKRITSAVDKQFVDLEDFMQNGSEYIERKAA